jgi:hypothetical protein
MPWCPKCRTEYYTGIHTCPDCNVKLVKELKKKTQTLDDAPLSRDAKPISEMGEYTEKDWEPIISVNNVQEAEMIIGLLDANDIHAVTKDRLGALRGLYGDIRFFDEKINIYVLKKEAEQALEIIRDIRNLSEDELTEMIAGMGGFEHLEDDDEDNGEEEEPE